MRTLDPVFSEAFDEGTINPFFRWEHRVTKAGAAVVTTENVMNFIIRGTEFDITLFSQGDPSSAGNENEFGRIIRGSVIGGTEYTIETSDFYITEYKKDDNFEYIKGSLVPNKAVAFVADGTYEEVFIEFCALFDLTAVFKHPTDTWLDYQFLPDGKSLTLNNANSFFPLLLQKYQILATDNGNNEILFEHAFSGIDEPEYTITDPRFQINFYNKLRRFVSRDEAASIRYTGDAINPLHNLGYLHSTASQPTVTTSVGDQESPILPIHLKYQDGDFIEMQTEQEAYLLLEDDSFFLLEDGSTKDIIRALGKWFKITVSEIFDSRKYKDIPWRVLIQSAPIFTNTAGGALPSTIERIAAYTPLVTINFDYNLDSTVNNLQALAEAVDDMFPPMGEISYFSTTGTNIVITAASDGSTNMVKAAPTSTFNNGADFDNGGSNNGRLRYTGTPTKMFHCACTITIAASGINDTFVFGVAKNGTVIAASKTMMKITAIGDRRSTAMHVMTDLATNDYLELYIGNLTDADDCTLHTLNIFAMGM